MDVNIDLYIEVAFDFQVWEELGMAAVGNKFVFKASSSPDVVGYRLRVQDKGVPAPTPSDPFYDLTPLLVADSPGDNPAGYQFDLAAIPGLRGLDGNYDLYLAAVDDAGNEQLHYTEMLNVPLDLVPPEPATDFRRL